MNNENILEINNVEEVVDSLTEFIVEQVNKIFKKRGVVIGLSGGLDSSVIAALCVRALGPKNVFGIIMPEKESNSNSIILAKNLAEKLEIKTKIVDISNTLKSFDVYQNKEQIIKKYFAEFNFRMKMYYPDTMNRLITDAGLHINNLWGDYECNIFGESSELQIYECLL